MSKGPGVRLGAVLPTREIGTNPEDLRQWIAGVESIGLQHIVLPDHVVGVDSSSVTEGNSDWASRWPHDSKHVRTAYTHESEFHEPMVSLGFASALTSLELVTGILVLAQRQTVLVAKQAAQLALLSNGRLRLGVGIGWNKPEFDALAPGWNFSRRARAFEEQVSLLRRLWSHASCRIEDEFHSLDGVGVAPRPPVQIPIWLGGGTNYSSGIEPIRHILERIGRIADGWYLDSAAKPVPALDDALEVINQVRRSVRGLTDPIPLDGRILLATSRDPDAASEAYWHWSSRATHVTFDSQGCGFSTPAEHVAGLERAMEGIR